MDAALVSAYENYVRETNDRDVRAIDHLLNNAQSVAVALGTCRDDRVLETPHRRETVIECLCEVLFGLSWISGRYVFALLGQQDDVTDHPRPNPNALSSIRSEWVALNFDNAVCLSDAYRGIQPSPQYVRTMLSSIFVICDCLGILYSSLLTATIKEVEKASKLPAQLPLDLQ